MFALPFVALIGFGRESDVKRAIEAGFTAHLSKLIDLFEKLRWERRQTESTMFTYMNK